LQQEHGKLAAILTTPVCAVAALVLVLALAGMVSPSPALAQATLQADENAMALPLYPAFEGGFDEM
jgi:hypothetical protein